jgi:hypothetical protein
MPVARTRLITKRQLHEAEELVASGLHHIVEQNRIVQELRASGRDTTAADQLLTTLLEVQSLHEEYRNWLRYELEDEAATRVRRTGASFGNWVRNTIETEPYNAMILALSVGWLLGGAIVRCEGRRLDQALSPAGGSLTIAPAC